MNSPLARVILSILGGYVVILLLWTAYGWIRAEYPAPKNPPPGTGRIQHPLFHDQALEALQRFSQLPEHERRAIKKSLESNLITMEQWVTRLDRSDHRVMCIGEFHEESTRNFLAEEFFATFSVDVLLLEAGPEELKRLIKREHTGRTYFPLLNADIMNILHVVRERNPGIEIYGIEETDEQQKNQQGHFGARDQSIARNFWRSFKPGLRHIILLGAFHCSNEPNWFFQNLNDQAPLSLKERLLNAQVLEEHQNGPLEAFVFFLDEIGIEKKNFVLADTEALHARIYELFPMLTRQTLKKYCALIVFRI